MAIANLAETVARTTPVLQGAVDDTNEAPWMTMPEFQYFVARLLVGILRLHAERRNLGWHVTGELAVITPKPEGGTLTLGPDVLVVEADGRLRDSWDVRKEGKPPRLVLEIVTPDSVERVCPPRRRKPHVRCVRSHGPSARTHALPRQRQRWRVCARCSKGIKRRRRQTHGYG